MSQKKDKPKPRKREPWNSFIYLADLAKKKEQVILHFSTNSIEDKSQLKGVIVQVDNYTIALLTDNGQELLVFKHAISFIEKVKQK